ncbi:hypothetical protein B0H13DRAFT_1865601 [Mycena leptocephala]|nr:hypothetical protein B0H13DRAFT_1865601 [Mycena leptocephala]
MGRRKTGKLPGRESAFSGEKLEWLLQFEEDFRTMERGAFYDMVVKKFLTRYGYDLAVGDNVPGDIEDWVPADRKAGLNVEELAEENDFQDVARKALRAKLGNWFRHRFTGKRLHNGAVNRILKRMQAMSGTAARPRRKPNVTLYSSKFYASKLKAGFDPLWEAAKETLPASARISMCQDYVKACWEKESDELKAEIAAESDALHLEALKKYRDLNSLPEQSAEEYHQALETFDEVGIPLADSLSERLGMHIVILAVGPVGSQRGEVRLRSVFSDTSVGQTTKMWGEFDRAAFTAAEVSLTRYGRAFFTKDECRARAWPPLEVAGMDNLLQMDDLQSGAGAAAVPAPVVGAVAAPVLLVRRSRRRGYRARPLAPIRRRRRRGLTRLLGREIAVWMKEHRRAGDNDKILPDFGERLLAWWRKIGPEFRQTPRPEDLAEGEQWPPQSKTGWEWDEWMGLCASGNNGVVLAVQALTWWGQSIINGAAGEGLGAGEAALAADEGGNTSSEAWGGRGDRGPACCLKDEERRPIVAPAERPRPRPRARQPKNISITSTAPIPATSNTTLDVDMPEAATAIDNNGDGNGRGNAEEGLIAPPEKDGADGTPEGAQAIPTVSQDLGDKEGMAAVEANSAPAISTSNQDEDGVDPFALEFADPFEKNPMAGLSEEERADLEAELALDAAAGEDEDEGDSDGAEN